MTKWTLSLIKFYLLFLIFNFLLFNFIGCVTAEKVAKKPIVKVPAGANIASVGMAFDVSYDPKTDNIIPGYKILSVAITNNSIDIIQTDRPTDKWIIRDYKGHEHPVITNLKEKDPDTYINLAPRLRQLIHYPMLIQVGETRVIDLLVKNNVNLDGFRSVYWRVGASGKEFEVIAND